MSEDSINQLKQAIQELLRPRVLIVEDNEDDAFLTANVLRQIGVDSVTVTTAAGACSLAPGYQLCFLDLKLPDASNPVELVNSIKKSNPQLKIAILTGTLQDGDLRRALEKQVLAVILKPIGAEQLKGAFT